MNVDCLPRVRKTRKQHIYVYINIPPECALGSSVYRTAAGLRFAHRVGTVISNYYSDRVLTIYEIVRFSSTPAGE